MMNDHLSQYIFKGVYFSAKDINDVPLNKK